MRSVELRFASMKSHVLRIRQSGRPPRRGDLGVGTTGVSATTSRNSRSTCSAAIQMRCSDRVRFPRGRMLIVQRSSATALCKRAKSAFRLAGSSEGEHSVWVPATDTEIRGDAVNLVPCSCRGSVSIIGLTSPGARRHSGDTLAIGSNVASVSRREHEYLVRLVFEPPFERLILRVVEG